MALRANSALLATCATALSAVLLFFGTGLHPIWGLTWLALIPLLLVVPRLGVPGMLVASFGAWLLGGLNMWHYYRHTIGIPLPAATVVMILPACIFSLIVLVHRTLARRGWIWPAAAAVPVLWVSAEYLGSVLSPHGTFGNLAYSQTGCLPVLQLAAVTGVWGISFCIFLFASVVALLLNGRRDRRWWRLAASAGVFFAAVFGYGVMRLWVEGPAPSIPVLLVASDLKQNVFPQKDADTLRLLQDYVDAIGRSSASQHARRFVVMPEKVGVLSGESAPQADVLLHDAAGRLRSTMVVGLDLGSRGRRENEARLYFPNDGPANTYVKHHLIPGIEDVDVPGTGRTMFRDGDGAIGIAICKDMDFPRLSREYGNDGVGLLLVPAWDFDIDAWLHSRMAVVRGVESGFSIARSAKQGFLTVSDTRGRVLAERRSSDAPFTAMATQVPTRHSSTIYARWGDWFSWLNLGMAVAILAQLFRKPRR